MMQENISKVIERGERLDDLQDKSGETPATACAYLPDMCALLKHERQEIPLLLLFVLRFSFQKDPTDLFYFGLPRYLINLMLCASNSEESHLLMRLGHS